MPNRVFISYRREDGAASARSICDRLGQVFGSNNIFMDVDSLVPGQRFDIELNRALSQCKVFLAVIGPRWMDLLKKREQDGEHDYVRHELASALARGMVVIPVLTEGARLPHNTQLPQDIAAVVMHQKQEITHERFAHDIAALTRAVQLATGHSTGFRWQYWGRWAGAATVAVLAVALGAVYFGKSTNTVIPQRKNPEPEKQGPAPQSQSQSQTSTTPPKTNNDHRIRVYNDGNKIIDVVRSSPCRAEEFGANKLGASERILPGESRLFDMSDGFKNDCCRDLRVVFQGGQMVSWWKVDVCKEGGWRVRN